MVSLRNLNHSSTVAILLMGRAAVHEFKPDDLVMDG